MCSFLCPILAPFLLIRLTILLSLKMCVNSMLSAPSSITSYISVHVITVPVASLCQIQGLSVTHNVTSLLLHLVFSWSLLVPTISPFIFNPHQLFICNPQPQLSKTSFHLWCGSLIMSLHASLLSLSPSLFSGMLTLPKAKLLHLFNKKYFQIPFFFFQLLYYLSYFDIKY